MVYREKKNLLFLRRRLKVARWGRTLIKIFVPGALFVRCSTSGMSNSQIQIIGYRGQVMWLEENINIFTMVTPSDLAIKYISQKCVFFFPLFKTDGGKTHSLPATAVPVLMFYVKVTFNLRNVKRLHCKPGCFCARGNTEKIGWGVSATEK